MVVHRLQVARTAGGDDPQAHALLVHEPCQHARVIRQLLAVVDQQHQHPVVHPRRGGQLGQIVGADGDPLQPGVRQRRPPTADAPHRDALAGLRRRLLDALPQGEKQRRLARPRRTSDEDVLAGIALQHRGPEVRLGDADGQMPQVAAEPHRGQLADVDGVGQGADRGRLRDGVGMGRGDGRHGLGEAALRGRDMRVQQRPGEHAASGDGWRRLLLGDAGGAVVVRVGQAEQPLLRRDLLDRRGHGLRARAGRGEPHLRRPAFGPGPVEALHQLEALEVVVLVLQARETVDEDHHRPMRAARLAAPVELGAHVLEEAHLLLPRPGSAGHVRGAVRQVGQRREVARPHVEHEQVELVGSVGRRGGEADRGERRAGARAGDAEQQQVAAVDVPADGDLALPVGVVGERELQRATRHPSDGARRHLVDAVGVPFGLRAVECAVRGDVRLGSAGDAGQRHRGPELRRPHRPWGHVAAALRGSADHLDQPVEVGGCVLVDLHSARGAAAYAAEDDVGYLDGAGLRLAELTGDQRRLHRRDVVLTELHVRPPLLGAADRGGVRHVDDVARVLLGLHAQGDAEVGVGEDVVGDDTGGPLGREDHVHAERAAHRADADQRGQGVGIVLRELGELVDDQQQPRQRL